MPAVPDGAAMAAIQRETWGYASQRPGRVPPADSPNRPYSAWLWHKANAVFWRRPKLRTFTYAGHKFRFAWMGGRLCVMDWHTQRLLVKAPTSPEALRRVLAEYPGCAR